MLRSRGTEGRRLLRTWIGRGYDPLPEVVPSPEWVIEPPKNENASWLLAFCPTFVSAANEATQRDTIEQMLQQLSDGIRTQRLPRSVLIVGMQHAPEARGEAGRRLQTLDALARQYGVQFCAFALAAFGKVKSLNVALRVANEGSAVGLLQVDDDIRLDDDCLSLLYAAFAAAGCRGAIGAAKIGLSRGKASRLLRWAKGHTDSATNYPHGCCMIFDPKDFAAGIPARFVGDDRYICFALLRPGEPNPLSLLQLTPAARCFYYVGGPAGRSVRRIRRLLLLAHIYMSAFPDDVSNFYLRGILFPGLLSKGAKRTSPFALCMKAAYFAAFVAVGFELVLRGLLGYPLASVTWAGFDDRAAPAAPANRALAEEN